MAEGTTAAADVSVIEPAAGYPAPAATPGSDCLRDPKILHLILALLAELGAPSDAVEYTLLPLVDQYAIRLPSARGRGEAILLPRRALERALVDRAARGRVCSLLRVWIESPIARRALSGVAPLDAYFVALDVGSLPGPRCACCQGPLLAEDPVVVREASRSHLICPPAW